jgi:hypothetical protein
LRGVVAGVFGLLLAGVLDLGNFAVFGFVLVAGLDLAFRDGDLVRLTVPALDLVFAAALAFAVFVFFLATMRAPLCSERQPAMSRGDADNQTTTKVNGLAGTGDRNILAKIVSYSGHARQGGGWLPSAPAGQITKVYMASPDCSNGSPSIRPFFFGANSRTCSGPSIEP